MRIKYAGLSIVAVILALMGLVYSTAQDETRNSGKLVSQQDRKQTPLAPGDVILSRSRIYVLVGKTGLGHEHGVIGNLQSGQVLLGAKESAGVLVFDTTSFDVDSPGARKFVGLKGESDKSTRKQVNDNMHGKDVLDTSKYPTSTFTIDSALPTKPTAGRKTARYELKGSFTLHGVTNPLKLICEATPQKDGVRLTTGFTALQSDYGIKPFSKAFGAIGVADELRIWGDLTIATGDQ